MLKIEINKQFKKALNAIEEGRSVFITGKAGTGKSTLLNYFRDETKKSVVILAPTGVAAVNVKGETIHSFFRFKPDITPREAEEIAKKTRRNKDKKELFNRLETIVIDEVSMVRADLLDCVDIFLKAVGKNKLPFGGKQMVFIGDLYQLPPVVIGRDREVFKTEYDSCYFFSAKAMKDFKIEIIELEKVYRQKDGKFIEILNSIRNNTVESKHLKTLNERFRRNIDPENFEKGQIYLATTNLLAEKINKINLEKLAEKKYVLKGEIDGKFDRKYLPTDPELEVKKGAQVMLLNNDSRGRWINGTVGEIVGFGEDGIEIKLQNGKTVFVSPFQWEIIETYFNAKAKALEKRILGSFIQYPIKLAWAITVHKSQGKTFDKVIIDLSSGIFACGQTYVALSRCRTLEGIILKKEITKSNVFTDWKVVRYLTSYQYNLSEKKCSKEDKIEIIKQAIENKTKLKIIYLKAQDQKSERIILPLSVGEMEYLGKTYLGMEAHCFLRNEERIFRVDRILEMELLNC